jgi:uncharacterized protein YjbI with pentapeptide repeats
MTRKRKQCGINGKECGDGKGGSMKFTIKSKFDGSVLLEVEAESFVKAVENKKANLYRANLSGVNLSGVNLSRANLSGADISRADISGADISGAVLYRANLYRANLSGANLSRADISGAVLSGAVLSGADIAGADISGADISRAVLSGAVLYRADISGANLSGANLSGVNLSGAVLYRANLSGANLSRADISGAVLSGANLKDIKNLIKIMGVEPGNYYWKRFEKGLCNNGYQFYVGLNTLREGEQFASDDRELCSYPGFHFASRSWCAVNYPDRPLEAKIRIPEDAQINEPWTTDGKASASAIEILQVFDVKTGEDVTNQHRRGT